MTRFSIYGYYGQGNAGDEAILAALIDGIKNTMPESTIGVYSARPEETKNIHGVDAYRFFGLTPKSFIKGVLRKTRGMYLKSITNYFRSDVIIIGGGGLFFDSAETNKWIFGYIDLIHRSKKHGKKVALVGISVGPLHHKGSEDAIRDAFNKVDLISVRDNNSKDLLIKCGVIEKKISVVPDLVFTLNSASNERIEAIIKQENFIVDEKPVIALTPCCYNINQPGWLEQYIKFCERAIAELDCQLWLIPMQQNEKHDDLTAINAIYSGLSKTSKAKAHTLNGNYSAKEIQGIISRANFVLAERLHGSIMAINTNTPAMSIAYMPKVVGVLELANLSDRIIKNADFLSGNFHDKVFLFYRRHIESQSDLEFTNAHPKLSANQNFKYLHQLSRV